jgi:hypothetical protein
MPPNPALRKPSGNEAIHSCCAHSGIPKGFDNSAQGWPAKRDNPGLSKTRIPYPKGVESIPYKPFFRGKDGTHEKFGKGLRHSAMTRKPAILFNPFRVGLLYISDTRGSECLATPG